MGAGVYLIQGNDQLVEMSEAPYATEAHLQELLARYPNLIPGDQINSTTPRRWLLVTREAAIPAEEDGAGRWCVDHLFLDQDAVPTLVEVKRSTDTRIRREVVGQMLDYAANCMAYWPVKYIRAQFEARCLLQKIAEDELRGLLDADGDSEGFWQRVQTNLLAGRIRLIFVADEIPAELRRVVDFLSKQMTPAEVFAVEIRQFCGQNLRTLVPRVVAGASPAPNPTRETRQWDEPSFLADLNKRKGPGPAEAARAILSWTKERRLRVWWGKGGTDGSFYPMVDHANATHHLVAVWSNGPVEIQFQFMQKQPPFDDEVRRRKLIRRFETLADVHWREDAIRKRPSFSLDVLQDKAALAEFLQILDDVVQEIRSADIVHGAESNGTGVEVAVAGEDGDFLERQDGAPCSQ